MWTPPPPCRRNPRLAEDPTCPQLCPLRVQTIWKVISYLPLLHQPQGCLVSAIEQVPPIHLRLESGEDPNRVLGSKSGGQHLGGLGRPCFKDERFEYRPNETQMEDPK